MVPYRSVPHVQLRNVPHRITPYLTHKGDAFFLILLLNASKLTLGLGTVPLASSPVCRCEIGERVRSLEPLEHAFSSSFSLYNAASQIKRNTHFVLHYWFAAAYFAIVGLHTCTCPSLQARVSRALQVHAQTRSHKSADVLPTCSLAGQWELLQASLHELASSEQKEPFAITST
jgi:hypothetical protein